MGKGRKRRMAEAAPPPKRFVAASAANIRLFTAGAGGAAAGGQRAAGRAGGAAAGKAGARSARLGGEAAAAAAAGTDASDLNAMRLPIFGGGELLDHLWLLVETLRRGPRGGGGPPEAARETAEPRAVIAMDDATLAAELAQAFKALTADLSWTVLAIHDKTPKKQRASAIEQAQRPPSKGGGRGALVFATFHTAPYVLKRLSAAAVLLIGGPTTLASALAAVSGSHRGTGNALFALRLSAPGGPRLPSVVSNALEGAKEAAPAPPGAVRSRIRRICAQALKVRRLAARAGGGGDRGDARLREILGAEADGGEGGGEGRGEGGGEGARREREDLRRQLRAAGERLSVLLRIGVDGAYAACAEEEMRAKMELLGMLLTAPQAAYLDGASAALGAAGRDAAATRWLDGAAAPGADWSGAVRFGASRSALQRRVRGELAAGGVFERWRANPGGGESHDWGGAYGKACGHNEVVMQRLRPFAPLEVVNTRVCGLAAPAPGNGGFEGCLEFLCLQCREHRSPMTAWDRTDFLYIDAQGSRARSLPKAALLCLELPSLRALMPLLRQATVAAAGRAAPLDHLRAIVHLALGALAADGRAADAAGALRCAGLPRRAELAVMEFALGRRRKTWRLLAAAVGAVEQLAVRERGRPSGGAGKEGRRRGRKEGRKGGD